MSKKDPINELKTSSFDRRLSIAKTSLNIGRRWVANGALGLFQSKDTRDSNNRAFAKQQAQYLVDELGKLKGSVVKIGQMLALYGETILPKEIVDALHTLDDKTAPLSWQSIYRTLYDELGERIHALNIDEMPIGTASLAQVHRATIKDTGEQIVLKVQYPGVAAAIDGDLSLFKQLLKITNIVPQTRALDEWFEEIKTLLKHEVDYTREAATTQRFQALLADDTRYIVPTIYPEFSTPRLLAMSFEHGLSLNNPKLSTLSQSARNALGHAAMDIVMQEIFVWGEMQTDPNFGNYLVRIEPSMANNGNPQLVLLDFGAVKSFDTPLISIAQNLLKAGYYQDKQAMLQAMTGYAFFETMSETVRSDMADVFLLATEPFATKTKLSSYAKTHCLDNEGHYRWAHSNLYNRTTALAAQSMQSREFSLPPKEMMFISRKFIGAYALLSALDARTDSEQLVGRYLR